MSGIRQSIITCPEDTFGAGKPAGKSWIAPPPGTFVSYTANRDITVVTAEGTKFWDTVAYNKFSGSWDWSCYMDYEYLEPLFYAFDTYSCENNGDGTYTHTFEKMNNARVRSFTMRGKILNRMVGGRADELTELVGCVVKSLRFTYSGGQSPVQIQMSGFYVDQHSLTGDLITTDYQEYDGQMVEFGCLFFGNSCTEDNYVALVDSLTISIENNAEALWGICSAFAPSFYEGKTNNQVSIQMYSYDFDAIKSKVYTGGYASNERQPRNKGLSPLPRALVASYDASIHDHDASTISAAINASDRTAIFDIEQLVFKSNTWQKGDGSKLQDAISSSECRRTSVKVKSNIGDLTAGGNSKHYVQSSAEPV